MSSHLGMLRKQIEQIDEAVVGVQSEMEGTIEVDDADIAGGASKKDVIYLILKTKQDGSQGSVAQAVWALKRAKGNRESARQIISYLPIARRVVAALREPATLGDFKVDSVPSSAKNRVALSLKAGGAMLRKQAESFLKVSTVLGKVEEAKKSADEARSAADAWEGQPFLLPGDELWMEILDGRPYVGVVELADDAKVLKPAEPLKNVHSMQIERNVQQRTDHFTFDCEMPVHMVVDGGKSGKWGLRFSSAGVKLKFVAHEEGTATAKITHDDSSHELEWHNKAMTRPWLERNVAELHGWLFPPYQTYKSVATLTGVDSRGAARVLAARELEHESRPDHFCVWLATQSKLFVKQPAGAVIPQLKGEANQNGATTFFHPRHQPVLDDKETANFAGAEVWLARWAYAVTAYGQHKKTLELAKDRLKQAQRANQRGKLERALKEDNERLDLEKECEKHAVNKDLYPVDDPWKLFPWQLQLRPAAEREEQLRKATGLRNLEDLCVLLQDAASLGLTKSNSKVCFEASELRDLLRAEGAAMRRSASKLGISALANDDLELPVPARQKTERVRDALFVFLEDVNNDVPSTVPLSVPYELKLRVMLSKFGAFVKSGEDHSAAEAILAAVSESSLGAVGEIEQEQEREQEQEQQKEQQKEQEIEMERYVDMAYLREGEEPVRWAFSSLGQTSGTAGKPTPFAEGTFYPASEFRLNARSPLPFPSYLSVSKNSFNLEWVGERRLKNSIMVLEWCPSVAALATLPPRVAVLTDAQSERLKKALMLLDVDQVRVQAAPSPPPHLGFRILPPHWLIRADALAPQLTRPTSCARCRPCRAATSHARSSSTRCIQLRTSKRATPPPRHRRCSPTRASPGPKWTGCSPSPRCAARSASTRCPRCLRVVGCAPSRRDATL